MKQILTMLMIVGTVCIPGVSWTEEAEEIPAWTGDLGLAYLATSGNSDTRTFGLGFTMERIPDPWGISIKATFDRADDSGELTTERYYAGVRGVRKLNDRWDFFAGLSGERDEFAGYSLLALLEVGATFKALTGPTHNLSFDMGATYTDEDRLEPEPDVSYMGAVLGLSYKWVITENASFTQDLVFFPNFADSDDWRVNSDTAVEAAISSRFALKFSYGIRYRNQPLIGKDSTDTTTRASIIVKF